MEIKGRFGGLCLPHLQGGKVCQTRYQNEAGGKPNLHHDGFCLGLLFDNEIGGDIFLRNVD
jgi:hypothetical protein